MSDTPRTDEEMADPVFNHRVSKDTYDRMANLARELERELNAANARIAEMEKEKLAARIRARISEKRWRLKNAEKIQRKPATARHKAVYHAGWQKAEARFRRWDEIEDCVVMEHKKHDRDLSAELGRSVTAIQLRRTKLKQRNEAKP